MRADPVLGPARDPALPPEGEPSIFSVEGGWPSVIIDALDAERLDSSAARKRVPSLFPPLLEPARKKSRPAELPGEADEAVDGDVVENEPGLCSRMEAVHRAVRGRPLCASWRLAPPAASTPTPRVPPLAEHVRAASGGYPFRLRAIDCPRGEAACLSPPLIFHGLIRNPSSRQAVLSALGASWVLPAQSAFALCPMERWAELARLRPPGGYRLLLLDPPWHSASVARKGNYTTRDKRELLTALAPAIDALACAEGCLVACWVTNSRHVQSFVEGELFARCGVRPVARWYWLKLAVDGGWATGAEPRSPHRKPWEVCLLGYLGPGEPPSAAALPERLAVVTVPAGHSCKPPLDCLLRRAAVELMAGRARAGAAQSPGAPPSSHAEGSGEEGDEEAAWRRLPKVELFAREVRPYWHAAGDEALHFQHAGFFANPEEPLSTPAVGNDTV